MERYIKVYTKILENPKVGRLDDKTWRIMMELFLTAGETFDDGKLPDAAALAWKLRRPEKDIVTALQKLAEIGTVTLSNDNSYDNAVITNFELYQNTNQTAYEKVKSYRKRQKALSNDNQNDNRNDNSNDNRVDNQHDNRDDVEMITPDIDIDIDINTVSKETDTRVEKTTKKTAHGSLKNVMLTADEYGKLKAQFPDADEKIEAMSLYFGSHGNAKKYKSHYATALNWARMAKERDEKAPQTSKAEPYKSTYQRLKEMGEI